MVLFRRTVAIVDGVGSADFQVPPLLKVNFVDPSGEPIFAVGILNVFEDEVIMPDGGVSYVFTSEFMIPTGPSVEIISLRDSQAFFNIEDYTRGTEYWGSINTIGADEITFDLSTGIMSVGGPDTPIPDADGDGILDAVDIDGGTGASPGVFGDAYVNGTIVSVPAGWSVLVSDKADPDGVRIKVEGVAGIERVTLSVCGFTLKVSAGSDVVLTCGSVEIEVTSRHGRSRTRRRSGRCRDPGGFVGRR